MKTISALNECINILQNTPNTVWAERFVELKMKFFRSHQMGLIFSTQFGADFFDECKRWIYRKDYISSSGGIVGEFDKNFNAWLKVVREEK